MSMSSNQRADSQMFRYGDGYLMNETVLCFRGFPRKKYYLFTHVCDLN